MKRYIIPNDYYEDTKLYSTGDPDLDDLLEKAFCDGYEYAQREFTDTASRYEEYTRPDGTKVRYEEYTRPDGTKVGRGKIESSKGVRIRVNPALAALGLGAGAAYLIHRHNKKKKKEEEDKED